MNDEYEVYDDIDDSENDWEYECCICQQDIRCHDNERCNKISDHNNG